MKPSRFLRWGMLIGGGAVLLQATSCMILELIQTGLLGVTAAGAIGLLRNL